MNEKIRTNLYYYLIGIISLFFLCFFPFLGSKLGIDTGDLPQDSGELTLFIVENVAITVCNILIFHCFVKQGKLNIKDDPIYKQSYEIFSGEELKDSHYKPKSPKRFFAGEYIKKGITVILGTLAGTVVLSQAILQFNVTKFISTSFTLILSIVFGIVEMKTVEEYWTEEFVNYVNINFEVKKDDTNEQQPISEPPGTSTEEQG